MRVLFVGANGKVGQKTIQALLAAVHAVTAFRRSVEWIPTADGLRLIKGDAKDRVALSKAVVGQDSVILTFGASLNRKTILSGTDLCEVTPRTVVDAMKNRNTPRILAMASIGAGVSRGQCRWIFRHVVDRVLLRRIVQDLTKQQAFCVGQFSQNGSFPVLRKCLINRLCDLCVFSETRGNDQPTAISKTSVSGFLSKVFGSRIYDGQFVSCRMKPLHTKST